MSIEDFDGPAKIIDYYIHIRRGNMAQKRHMQLLDGIFLVWLFHIAIASVLSAPIIVLVRKRIHWRLWELAAFVAPFGVWLLLRFSELSVGKKSLANVVEPFYFSLAVPIAALVRVAIGTRAAERACACVLIVMLCGVAAAVCFIVPSLPE